MPTNPTLPTDVGSGTLTGHFSHTNVVHGVVNATYTANIGTTETTGFTVAQSHSGEVKPVNSGSSVAATVPVLAVGTSVELIRQGAGALTLTASGTTFLQASGTTAAARVQGSSIQLLWLTTTLVFLSGDLA
jgi:hypothetical protein